MTVIPISQKGQGLLKLYKEMADNGYNRADGSFVPVAFSDFELRAYRGNIRPILKQFEISTVLDYGSGGSDWNAPGFDESGQCAVEYFGLSAVTKYEPARDVDQRGISDCVICFDVLEHVHILDVRNVLIDIFRNAAKLVIINVACYSAAALLPNGENAHITVRHPLWWKGLTDLSRLIFQISQCGFCVRLDGITRRVTPYGERAIGPRKTGLKSRMDFIKKIFV